MLAKQIKMKGKISVVYVEISLTVHHLCFLFTICDGKRTLLQRCLVSLACRIDQEMRRRLILNETGFTPVRFFYFLIIDFEY